MSATLRTPLLIVMMLCMSGLVAAAELVPKLDIGRGGHCVEDPKFMRKNHMNLIVHQRDDTLRLGMRGSKYELSNCVNCHASDKNQSVLGSSENFCQGCHEFAAVKIDCFECHSSKRETQTSQVTDTSFMNSSDMNSSYMDKGLLERVHE